MRCNRKAAYFAVTPLRKPIASGDVTKVWQLRRREKIKQKFLKMYNFNC